MKQTLIEFKDRKESELLVFIKAKDLSTYILLISGKSPVKYRYSLLNPLINNSLDIIQLLYEANELDIRSPFRLALIRKAKVKLKTIGFLTSIAKDTSCFRYHQHDIILEKIGVCFKDLQGYYNSCKKALNI